MEKSGTIGRRQANLVGPQERSARPDPYPAPNAARSPVWPPPLENETGRQEARGPLSAAQQNASVSISPIPCDSIGPNRPQLFELEPARRSPDKGKVPSVLLEGSHGRTIACAPEGHSDRSRPRLPEGSVRLRGRVFARGPELRAERTAHGARLDRHAVFGWRTKPSEPDSSGSGRSRMGSWS